jgi:hypothetical protein
VPTSLEESARLAGGHCWVEARLFEIAGAWVPTVPEAAARLLLDRHSRHHAWRSRQWRDRLPVLADVERDALCVAPEPAWERALERLAAADDTVGRLAGLYRAVVPRLATRYREHAARAGEVSDGASRRTLSIVSADLAGDWQEGEALLENLICDPDRAGAAAGAAGAVEAELVRI